MPCPMPVVPAVNSNSEVHEGALLTGQSPQQEGMYHHPPKQWVEFRRALSLLACNWIALNLVGGARHAVAARPGN